VKSAILTKGREPKSRGTKVSPDGRSGRRAASQEKGGGLDKAEERAAALDAPLIGLSRLAVTRRVENDQEVTKKRKVKEGVRMG